MEFLVLDWITESFGLVKKLNILPFSAKIGTKSLTELNNGISLQSSKPVIEGMAQKFDVKAVEQDSQLEFFLQFKIFPEENAVELILFLTNRSSKTSPIIEALQVFDFNLNPFLPSNSSYILHYNKGSHASKKDFQPQDVPLIPNKNIHFEPVGGRSSNRDALPFFHLESPNLGGVFLVVGWSGQWASNIILQPDGKVHFQLGMAHLRIALNPGETIRTPKLLIFPWRPGLKSDSLANQNYATIDGHNMFRRFFIAHYAPRRHGHLVQLPLACYGMKNWRWRGSEANTFTEANQKEYADGMAPLKPEVFWIDAGWFEGRWPNGVGSWTIRKDGFPNGLRPISDYVKQYNMKMLLWFEPERVHKGSWIHLNHPEFCLSTPRNKNHLFDLGNLDAREWLINHLSHLIEKEGIGIYRLDFNRNPIKFWKQADTENRQGIHEIRHIEGLYAMWDELLKRFPDIIFDNCASGGRRMDLETMSRCVAFTCTDYHFFEPNGPQCHTHAINLYLPTTSTFTNECSAYKFRSVMTNGIMLNWDPFKRSFNTAFAKKVLDEFRSVRSFYVADYYPITPYSFDNASWCAYQFHSPSENCGCVLVFRRKKARSSTLSFKMNALNPKRTYVLSLSNDRLEIKMHEISGADLCQNYTVEIPQAPGSLLIRYSIK